MPEFFSYNPDTGVTHSTDFDEVSGRMFLHASQDLEPLIERNKLYKIHAAKDSGIKQDMFHYASIPSVVQLELRKRGLSIFSKDPAELLKIRQIIQNEYPALMTTEKKIWIPKKAKKEGAAND